MISWEELTTIQNSIKQTFNGHCDHVDLFSRVEENELIEDFYIDVYFSQAVLYKMEFCIVDKKTKDICAYEVNNRNIIGGSCLSLQDKLNSMDFLQYSSLIYSSKSIDSAVDTKNLSIGIESIGGEEFIAGYKDGELFKIYCNDKFDLLYDHFNLSINRDLFCNNHKKVIFLESKPMVFVN